MKRKHSTRKASLSSKLVEANSVVTMGKNDDRNGTAKPATVGCSVIPILNKLHDIIAPLGGDEVNKISLPQVAVVGSQSSGKSSVLEALVGRDFLPRGCDICTRRPLCLMLEHRTLTGGEDDGSEWGEFRHLPGKRFYDFSEIRREIQAETERDAGVKKGVSDKQIGLKISSPNVVSMTLIDLPGITKVPVGDQPRDIETMVRRMIMSYISQTNCIILAVSQANSDLATSDALNIAREADPNGSRTIGVLTKLDIMDKGTNACNFLLGGVVPLRLGYVGVINRSQEDINHNRSIQEALAREQLFFRDNPVYKNLSDRCGIPMLAKKINQILEQQIRMVLPKLKEELDACMVAVRRELRVYGEAVGSEAEKEILLLNLLRQYSEALNAMVDGKTHERPTNELVGGARIQYIFQSIFVKSLEEMDPLEDLNDDDIRTAIQNSSGPGGCLYVPEAPFQVLVSEQIARLLNPSLQCLRFVHDEMIKRFPNLRKCLDEVIAKFFRDGLKPAESIIATIIEIEKNCINYLNPNFIGGEKAIELARQQLRSCQGDVELEKLSTSDKGKESQATNARQVSNGALSKQEHRPHSDSGSVVSAVLGGSGFTRRFGISSLFGNKASLVENSVSISVDESFHPQNSSSTNQLRGPPSVLKLHEPTEKEAVHILVTKLLLKSYFDIVRKQIEDQVPKIILYFVVHYVKRDFHHLLIQKLYRENSFGELLQEPDEAVAKRKHALEVSDCLQDAILTLEELESVVLSQNSTLGADAIMEFPEMPYFSSNLHIKSGLHTHSHQSSPKPLKLSDSSNGRL